MRILMLFLLINLPFFSKASQEPAEYCKSIAGDYLLECSGEIPKIEDLRRLKITVMNCLEVSFILEGKNTVTGRVFFPKSKENVGALITENTEFNDGSLRLVVKRSAKWNDDYSQLEMDTMTEAFDASGKNISSKIIILSLINKNQQKILELKNNDKAADANSIFQNAFCRLKN